MRSLATTSLYPSPRHASVLRRFWRLDAPLAACVAVLAALAVVCLVGLAVDPRTLGGAPVWTKPLKFCISGALYAVGVAVLIQPIRERWTGRLASVVVAAVMAIETVLIAVQAGRGVGSHFNVATVPDAVLFFSMGAMIGILWIVTAVAAVAVLLTPSADALWKRASVWGLALTLAGGAVGPLMTTPTPDQIAALGDGTGSTAGAHTVGAPDGGAGAPLVGWSTAAGDLRVPHFWGLHGLQALPLLALWLRRRSFTDPQRRRLLTLGGFAYAVAFVGLLAQALAGQSVFAPGTEALALTAALLITVALAARLILRRP